MIGRWTVVNAVLVLIVLALGGQIGLTWMRSRPALPVLEADGLTALILDLASGDLGQEAFQEMRRDPG